LLGGLSFERKYDRCCDGEVIWKRTISKNCWSFGPGLYARIPLKLPKIGKLSGKPSIDSKDNECHCGEKEWTTDEHTYGGDLIIYGRDRNRGNKYFPLGLGGYWDWHKHCRYTVVKQEKDGCCKEEPEDDLPNPEDLEERLDAIQKDLDKILGDLEGRRKARARSY
jgi:hypothetical protein